MAAEAGDDEVRMVEEATAPAPADVVVDLCPTLRAPGPQIPTVRAVYDISHLVAPSAHTLLERTRRGWSAALLTRRAAAILCPSLTISRGLVDYLRVPEERLAWIPTIGPGWRRAPRAEVERVRAQLGLKPAYLVFVGTISARKNLRMLLQAWDRLWPELGQRADLVVAGAGADPELVGEVVAGGARYLGPLPDDQLLCLLSGATALVCPSLAEGVSMGALEAMALGAPPLVAAGTALADVVGNAGMVLPAGDPAAWTAAMRLVLTDSEERNRMAARGLRAVADLREPDAGRRALAAALAAARTRT